MQGTPLKKIQRRKGTFGGYIVLGLQYAGPSGPGWWYVTILQPGRDPVHDYWVDDAAVIREASCRMDYGGQLLFERSLDPIVVIPEESQAILDAIQYWNSAP
jgi:hypothetical protein